MNQRSKAQLALIGTAFLWSTGGILIKSIGLNAFAICGFRSIVAVIFFSFYYKLIKVELNWDFVLSMIAYVGTTLMFVLATKMTSSANAILLQYIAPVFVCLFSWLIMKEKPSRLDLSVIGLVLLGMILFFLDSLSTATTWMATLGNFLAIISGISFGLQAVMMRKLRIQGSSPESILLFGNIACFLISLPFLFEKVPTFTDLSLIVLLGIFQYSLAYVFYNFALRYVSALEMVLIPIVEPLLNPLWVFLFLHEIPGIFTLIGGGWVLITVTTWCLYKERRLRLLQKTRNAVAS